MVGKRPKSNGPLVNSWPARLLTLEIARFSLICWDPEKCRNHNFCTLISFAYTQPLKVDPKKEGPKTSPSTELYQQNPPPPARLLTLPFGSIKNSGQNSVFRFSRSRFLAHFPCFCFWFCSPLTKKLPQNLCHSFGVAKKPRKTRVLFACLVADCFGGGVFPCGVLMLVFLFMYLLRCKCVIRPCCLTCSFRFLFVFRCVFFFWGGGVIHLFTLITSMVLHQ